MFVHTFSFLAIQLLTVPLYKGLKSRIYLSMHLSVNKCVCMYVRTYVCLHVCVYICKT